LPSEIVHYEAGSASRILAGLDGGKLLSDIVLRTADEEEIEAHKAILSASSDFLRRKINATPEMKCLDLSDCPGQAVRDLIGFLYTSRLSITAEGAKELLSTAVRLELASAQQAVENFLKLRLTVPLVLQTLNVRI
jgi:hypothetical protein